LRPKLLARLARLTVPLAFVDLMLIVQVIRNQASTCTHPSSNQGTFAATEQTSHHRATRCGATYDLRFRVVSGVVVALLTLCFAIGILPERMQRHKPDADEECDTGLPKVVHGLLPLMRAFTGHRRHTVVLQLGMFPCVVQMLQLNKLW